jgi:hypothetical protein
VRTATSVLALGAALVALPAPAFATKAFPGTIRDYVKKKTDMDPECPVPCKLCHTREEGGLEYMKERGFIRNLDTPATPIDWKFPTTLVFALDGLAMRACFENPNANPSNPCDTDRDGMGDVAELLAGRNPEGPGEFECPQYGCGAGSIAPAAPDRRELGALWVFGALGAVALARVRSRRARTR